MLHSGSTGPDEPLRIIGERFALLHLLREEPWGEVWLAQDRLLGVDWGLKFLDRVAPQFEAGREILQQEAVLALKLRHPKILEVFYLGETGEGVYLLEAPFAGESLLSLLTRCPRLSLPQALKLLEQVAEALSLAHRQGVVHRSLSPLAVLLKGEEVQLANFAFPAGDDEAVSHLELRAYTPPEVLKGEPLTPAGNVFSLGVLGFRLLAGSLPYPLTFEEALPYRLESPPLDLEEIPTALQNLLLHCLALDPEERFEHAGEFLGQFQELQETWSSGGRESWGGWQPTRRWPRWVRWRRPALPKRIPLAAGALTRLGEEGRLLAAKLGKRLQPAWERWRPLPRRLLGVLALAGVAFILLLTGPKLLQYAKSPPPESQAVPEPKAPAPRQLPAVGGPPLREVWEPSPGTPQAPRAGRAAAPAAAVRTPAQRERYLVLAASYARRQPALALQKRLRAQNLPATVAKVSLRGKPGYQVRLGPLAGRKAAEEMAAHLKSQGLAPKITRLAAGPTRAASPRSPAR
jgi:hypothetical protein